MRLAAAAVGAAAALLLSGGAAWAGAWPLGPGETQVIIKYERGAADRAFDGDGTLRDIPSREEDYLSAFVEHGLADRLTLQARAGLTRGEDAFVSYEGEGPAEVGLRWALRRDARSPISLYAGVIAPGAGRNGGYPAPDASGPDYELRLLAGRTGRWRGRDVFVEGQVARIVRSGLPDETRLDGTVGVHLSRRWLVLAQTYAGRADAETYRSEYVKAELSAVRELGRGWRVQAGWRATIAGREAPADHGPVLALWRSF